jgi:hypothetical protein
LHWRLWPIPLRMWCLTPVRPQTTAQPWDRAQPMPKQVPTRQIQAPMPHTILNLGVNALNSREVAPTRGANARAVPPPSLDPLTILIMPKTHGNDSTRAAREARAPTPIARRPAHREVVVKYNIVSDYRNRHIFAHTNPNQ